MDWSEATFAIVATFCTVILIVIWIVLHYIKKIVNWITRPVTSRTTRK